MKKLFMIASFFAAFVANGQAVDTLSLYVIGANGRLVKADTGITNIIQPYRSANTIKYRLNINGIFHGVSTDTDFVARQKQVIPNFASNVFAGTATPPSLSNGLLYNVINDYTGENVNYNPITTFANGNALVDSNADGVLVRKVNGVFYMLTKQTLTLKDFGAKGDGVTDNYAAIQKAVNVCSYWGINLNAGAGVYNFSQTITLPLTYAGGANTFFTISIKGAGADVTNFRYTGSGIAFLAIGGSGNISHGGLYDLTITGSSTTIGLKNMGRDGLCTYRCVFGPNAIGILLNNNAPGTFTEFSVHYQTVFANTCVRKLAYTVGDNTSVLNAGYMYTNESVPRLIDYSFHGSGLVDATFNSSDTTPAILIGAGAMPYNAPMSFQCWAHTSAYRIIDCESGLYPDFHGAITVETFTNPSGILDATFLGGGKGNGFSFQGTVESNGECYNGTLYKTNSFKRTQPSEGNALVNETSNESYDSTFVGTDTVVTAAAKTSFEKRYVIVNLEQSNYIETYELSLTNTRIGVNASLAIEERIFQFNNGQNNVAVNFYSTVSGLVVEMVNPDGSISTVPTKMHINFLTAATSMNTIK